MDSVWPTAEKVLLSVPYFASLLGLLLAGKWAFDKTTAYNFDDELTEKDNPAFGTFVAMIFLSMVFALSGIMNSVEGHAMDFVTLAVYGPLLIVLLRLGVYVNDKFILPNFSITKEISTDRNVGTAFVVGGSSVATGLILSGAMSGESVNFWRGLLDLTYYWFIGQLLLIAGGYLFTKIVRV